MEPKPIVELHTFLSTQLMISYWFHFYFYFSDIIVVCAVWIYNCKNINIQNINIYNYSTIFLMKELLTPVSETLSKRL